MKNIYIVGLLFLTIFILGGSKVYATPPNLCSGGYDTSKQEATPMCIEYLIQMLKPTVSGTYPQGSINIRSFPAEAPAFVDISSSLSPNVFNYLKDNMLADFVYKIVVIFGVGYLVTRSLFKR
jgi:hypothetical protein